PAWQPQEAEPSGFSWGPQMPAEENQYNFGGSYVQYFEHVYRAEFPEYRVEFSDPRYGRGKVVTFFSGSATALIVELLPKSTDSKKLRADCAARGIPYLRFYYDREGWWNTRAYVVKRTRDALGGQR
ncbi:MAG: hypothetical protein Q3982_08080, partial [Phoenicibacter congonensis]|nr:hypothetical protein [Phoenicibacter congonensis]